MNSDSTIEQSKIQNLKSEIAAGLICLLYFAFLIYVSPQHPFGTYATETDFYHLYAPDAARIAAGQFPLNSYQGPGYPVLLSLVTKFTGDVFVAGKWISMISAVLCVWLMFMLFKQLFSEWVGVGAALLSTTVIEFPEFSLQATTDVFFLLLCLVAFVIFTGAYFSLRMRVIFAAFFTGVAYLTRYNGVFLLACFAFAILIMNLFEKAWRERAILTGIFLVAFSLTVFPWLMANAQHNGSPLYNTNYLNMATLFYPELAGGEVTQDGTRKAGEMFHSFGEVLRYNPGQAFVRYVSNVADVFWKSWQSSLVSTWVGLLGMLGALLTFADRRKKEVWLLLLSMLAYFILMGLNHWETRYFFFIGVCYAGLSSYFIHRFAELAGQQNILSVNSGVLRWAITAIFFSVIWIASFLPVRASFTSFMQSHPHEIPAAAKFLQSTNATPQSLKILARKPHLPFMANQDWVFFPPVKSLDELKSWLEKNPVNYIAIGKRELKSRKELAPLGDPKTAPDWLEAAWTNDDPKFILYKPKW
jgi:4-amino-4-deoxy-L-arabinose transferase-like glycosyltransferase